MTVPVAPSARPVPVGPKGSGAAGARLAAIVLVAATLASTTAGAAPPLPAEAMPVLADVDPAREIHMRIVPAGPDERRIALTLDLCMGGFDAGLLDFLIAERIPATLFATKRWLDRHADAALLLRRHADLFQVENHGERHVPAVIGRGRRVYGIAGHADVDGLRRELAEGARAVQTATGVAPRWYRTATARYDRASLAEIEHMGFRVAGFSVSADDGATLPRASIEQRMARVRPGDVVLAHLNHPEGATGVALRAVLPLLRQRGLRFVRLDEVELRRTD